MLENSTPPDRSPSNGVLEYWRIGNDNKISNQTSEDRYQMTGDR